jgi:hypothetical protein
LVAEASGSGPGAVLKLMIPRPGDHARNEITVLRLAGGDGCALACAARRAEAHDDERAVLVHGDVHQWNVLEAPPGDEHQPGFKLVDPDGLLCTLIDLQPAGREMLATADYVAARPPAPA